MKMNSEAITNRGILECAGHYYLDDTVKHLREHSLLKSVIRTVVG